MMWILFLQRHWLPICGAILLGSLAMYSATMKFQRDSAREDLRALRNDVQAERIRNQAAIDEVKARSNQTIARINHEHNATLAAAKKAAQDAYAQRYPDTRRNCVVSSNSAIRLPNVSGTDTAKAGVAGSAEAADATESITVLDPTFLDAAVEAALMIRACQTFITGNGFQIEP